MKMLKTIAAASVALFLGTGLASAEAFQETAKTPPGGYSFEGPFGHFDKAQLQRGYKVYKEVCANCHSMRYVHFRNLADPGGPGFTEEQVKALALGYKFQDGPDKDGNMFERQGLPSDPFPSPFPNENAARAANGGSYPPDLSLITKARAGWYGTINQFVNGIGGPEYVYSVLTGYEQPSAEIAKEQPEGKYYNPYFSNGHWIGMPPNGTLTDDLVKFDDGTKGTIDQMAHDVSAFLAWTAEPKMEERKRLGFMSIIYLGIFALLMYLVKQHIWRDQH